ncbi:hypothetical protein B0J13DRAFT_96067 [Dactylonectria estremocensis]|uniref:Uncharacterized protein n=1 Tax=Dactylonectria estremocensis TaxID=1079267 RepID=A0A9P9E7A9_9HYPO|nr:hypothetical protein B0J13DRAFT_96067 [Dactylonectria estremocensis]
MQRQLRSCQTAKLSAPATWCLMGANFGCLLSLRCEHYHGKIREIPPTITNQHQSEDGHIGDRPTYPACNQGTVPRPLKKGPEWVMEIQTGAGERRERKIEPLHRVRLVSHAVCHPVRSTFLGTSPGNLEWIRLFCIAWVEGEKEGRREDGGSKTRLLSPLFLSFFSDSESFFALFHSPPTRQSSKKRNRPGRKKQGPELSATRSASVLAF